MKRSLSLVLAIALVFTSMLGVISFADTPEAEASISISQANVEFGNTVYLLIAVDYTAAYETAEAARENITLTVDGKVLTPDGSVAAPEGTIGFKYVDLGAKNMGDILEIKAYNGTTEADSTTYSILEYAIKAKAIYDDELLEATVDAMIEFGAAAQTAFNYKGDYDLSKEHGMAVVGGSLDGKYIAEVGSVLTPVADDKIFTKEDVKLYNLTFDVVESGSVTVADGVSRYFFYGSDLWGAEGSYDAPDEGKTTSPNAGCNLDLDLYSGAYSKLLVSAKAGVKNGYKYSLRLDRYLKTGVIEALTASGVNYGATSASSQRPWRLESPSTQNTEAFKDGYREIDKGWLHLNAIDDPATEGTVAPAINLAAAYTAAAKNFVVDGKFTVTLSIAKKAGEAYTENPFAIDTTKSSLLELCHVEGNTVKIGDTVITNLREFSTDAPVASDFTVFHFVVDVNDGTVTVYTDDGACVKVDAVIDGASDISTVISGGGHLRWSIKDGSVWINRCAMSEGDLFN